MSNPSPIVSIRDWLLSQPENIQHEIALQIAYPLFDVDSALIADKATCIPLVVDWLDDTIARHLQLGRILSITACLDHMLRYRDSIEDWAETEITTRQMVEATKHLPGTGGGDLLASLPERRDQWIKIAADWYKLRDTIFAGKNLDAWVFKG